MKYKYSKIDQSTNRSLYMYSSYQGKKFFKYFRDSRNINFKKFTLRVFKSNLFLTKKKISIYLEMFEKKKKVILNNKELEIDEYIEISYFLSKKLLKNIDLINLNSLIKLNDYIIYLIKRKRITNNKLLRIFEIEKKLINKILKNNKIYGKIKF